MKFTQVEIKTIQNGLRAYAEAPLIDGVMAALEEVRARLEKDNLDATSMNQAVTKHLAVAKIDMENRTILVMPLVLRLEAEAKKESLEPTNANG